MSNGPRTAMRRYLRGFLVWARTLNDDDLRAVCGFLQALKSAHYQGQQNPVQVLVGEEPKVIVLDDVHQGEPQLEQENDNGPAN